MLLFLSVKILKLQISIIDMKYYFPLHLDAGNRGCQGIAEGTAEILNVSKDKLIGYCSDVDLDTRLGVTEKLTLLPMHKVSLLNKITKQFEKLKINKVNRYDLNFKYQYKWFLDQITREDIMISTGGDMMCYGNNMVITTNDILHDRGIKTILWGCSMGKENETPEKIQTLKNFSIINARESLSFEYFKSIGLENVVCYPDPAFVLKAEECELPSIFSNNDVIGINISPFTLKNNEFKSNLGQAVINLVHYILDETELTVLLIPHVLWCNQDDRITAKMLKDYFFYQNRVSILDSDKFNYMQLRYIISKCRLFIGARTHAVISAYSTCVPTLALGYSIKSKGIAKDLNLPKETVIDCTKCEDSSILVHSLKFLIENERYLYKLLYENIPGYVEKAYNSGSIFTKL